MSTTAVKTVLGHWLYCERCRNPQVVVDESDGSLRIGGITLPDVYYQKIPIDEQGNTIDVQKSCAEYHRDNTMWFEVRGVGAKCGHPRKPPETLLSIPPALRPKDWLQQCKDYEIPDHRWRPGDLVLVPNRHPWGIKRVAANEAYIDEGLPVAVKPAGE